MNKSRLGFFLNIVSKISIVSVLNLVFGIVRNKVFALTIGVSGLGIIGQLVNLNNFVIAFISLGIPLGITKFVSELSSQNNNDNILFLLKRTLLLLLAFSMILAIILIIFSESISFFIWNDIQYDNLIIFLSLSFPISIITIVFDAYIRGMKRFNLFTINAIGTGVIGTIVFVASAIIFFVDGIGFAYLLSAVICLLYSYYLLKRNNLFSIKKILGARGKSDVFIRNIIKLGIASVIVGAMNQLSFLFIRSRMISEFGLVVNGYYQTIIGMSSNYFLLFSMILGVYSLPALSSIANNDEFNQEINNTLKISTFLIVPVVTLMFVFREQIVVLLFSKDFNEATHLFYYYLFGDFFRILGLSSCLWLIPRMKIKSWLFIEMILNISLILWYLVLTNLLGVKSESFSVSYFISYCLYFIISFLYLVYSNNFKLTASNYKLINLSVIAVSLLLFISNVNIIAGYIIIFPLIVAWFLLSFDKENYLKILEYIKRS